MAQEHHRGSTASITAAVITAAHTPALWTKKKRSRPRVGHGGLGGGGKGWRQVADGTSGTIKHADRRPVMPACSAYMESAVAARYIFIGPPRPRPVPPVPQWGRDHLWVQVSNIQSPLKRSPQPRLREMTMALCFFPHRARSLRSSLAIWRKTCREASLLRAKPDNAWANTAESPFRARGSQLVSARAGAIDKQSFRERNLFALGLLNQLYPR